MSSSEVATAAPVRYRHARVRALFDELADTYGWSGWLSGGLLGRWRRQLVRALREPAGGPPQVVDLMAGGAELWPALRNRFGASLRVDAVDFSASMLARSHTLAAGPQLHLHQADALNTPVPSGQASAVTVAFGLKTLAVPEYAALAEEAARLLRPGGEVALVEFVLPAPRWQWLVLERYVAGWATALSWWLPAAASHAELLAYAGAGPDWFALRRALAGAGFEQVRQQRLWPGCAVLLTAVKTPAAQ